VPPWPVIRLTLVSVSLVLAVGWHPAGAQGDAPEGCHGVFLATSRGGAATPLSGGSCNPFRQSGERVRAEVSRVIDGDTIVVGGGARVRYVGVDTPEVGEDPEPFGPEATELNRRLVEGRSVLLVKDTSDRDRFGRLLRIVYADGILVNAELVREGYARAVVFLPDDEHAGCFAALDEEARTAGRGMWAETPTP
jgi:endonuclease YncB( thermonuclease family)